MGGHIDSDEPVYGRFDYGEPPQARGTASTIKKWFNDKAPKWVWALVSAIALILVGWYCGICGGNNPGAQTPGTSWCSICTGLCIVIAGTSGFAMWNKGAFDITPAKGQATLRTTEGAASAVHDPAHTKAHATPYHQAKIAAPQSGSNTGTIVLIVFILLAVIGLAGLGYWMFQSRSKSVKEEEELNV